MQEVGRHVYEQVSRPQGGAPGAGGGPAASEQRGAAGEEAAQGAGGKGKVIDADFEVK
jgi:hypothetical protein